MAKILLYDLETSAHEMRGFGHYDVRPIAITRPSELLSVAWKYLDDKKPTALARKDYKKVNGDYSLAKAIYDVMSDADLIIAHNLKGFDHTTANTRFIKLGLSGVPNAQVVDTLEVARRYFKFPGNSLNDLAKFLDVGGKLETGGKELWNRCAESDPAAFKKMREYNAHDVTILERVYLKLRPYIQNHPNLRLLDPNYKGVSCPNCGSEDTQKRGLRVTVKVRQQRYQCRQCGSWFTGKLQVGK